MTREEKIQQMSDLLNITGNTTKLIRFLLVQAANGLPPEEDDKIEAIIAILLAE